MRVLIAKGIEVPGPAPVGVLTGEEDVIMARGNGIFRSWCSGGRRAVRRGTVPWIPSLVAALLIPLEPNFAAGQEPTNNSSRVRATVVVAYEGIDTIPIPVLVERYRRELEASEDLTSETRRILFSMLTGYSVQVEPNRFEELVAALEAIVRGEDVDSEVRSDAASLLAVAAEADLPKPRPELTELILRLYPDVDDELVRRYLMSSMAQLADRDRALAFLRKIAEQEKDSFPDEACKAIRVLLAAGPDGPRIIREIRDAKSARNEGIQRVVDFLVEDGFKVWPPC